MKQATVLSIAEGRELGDQMRASPRTSAWHFVGEKLRDGSALPKDGEWLIHTGPLIMCQSGLHAGLHPLDALTYAPGPTLCYVELAGNIIQRNDKVAASQRRIIARTDATLLLRNFAKACALDVIHLWKAPQVVIDFLHGEESLRKAARTAAWDAQEAAQIAAWAAQRDAEAWALPAAAAWVTQDAAQTAAWAAQDAAWDAAREAKWTAVAARAAPRSVVWAALEATQRKDFLSAVLTEFRLARGGVNDNHEL